MKLHRFFPMLLVTLLLAACQSTPTPTATALPTETIAPTVVPAASPTTALASATPPPTATLAPTASPNQDTSVSACDLPYYPVKADAKWVYHITYSAGGLPPADYTVTDTHLSAKGFVEHSTFAGVSSDIGWTCSTDGLLSTQFASLTLAAPGQFKFTTLKSSGVTLPAPSQWKVGTTWKNGYDVKGELVAGGNTATAQGTVTYASTIAAQESVSVPAGTFTALRVDSTVTIALAMTVSGISAPTNFSFQVASWYVPNMGMVKTVTTGKGINATTELTSFSR
jgi:hypothetical protein